MLYSLPDRTPQIHPLAFVAPSADVIGAGDAGCRCERLVWGGFARR